MASDNTFRDVCAYTHLFASCIRGKQYSGSRGVSRDGIGPYLTVFLPRAPPGCLPTFTCQQCEGFSDTERLTKHRLVALVIPAALTLAPPAKSGAWYLLTRDAMQRHLPHSACQIPAETSPERIFHGLGCEGRCFDILPEWRLLPERT